MQEGWGISPTVYIAVFRGAEAGGMRCISPNSIYSRVQGCRSRRDGVYSQQYIKPCSGVTKQGDEMYIPQQYI